MDDDGQLKSIDLNRKVQKALCSNQLQNTCQLMVEAMSYTDCKPFLSRKPDNLIQDYIDELIDQYDHVIDIFRKEPKGYISKAAVLVLANKWTDARLTLGKGLMVCSDKDEIREALNRLNHVFRETESVKTSSNRLNYYKRKETSSLPTVKDEESVEM
ncbi:hypothetical protein TrispH2_002371 [Trichoplax sp. H2]|uniref:Uncharacterized protein n=1 Tax=Trichoplax adhaerens TaxID=10228 RepID=B3S0F5_TRIAD|nr:predicted protein [Trichoplax adhaerens]EDV23628.1 predicted protein [Trichoplax adhaerens]RDD44876.1 hypothetical protein TrispH2_002371 [Trichoplax sp. H2]|eukprot:XP_002113154.1 predicted protein [Trichoplax adhaerens]